MFSMIRCQFIVLILAACWSLVRPTEMFRFLRTPECGQNEILSQCGPCDNRCPWKSSDTGSTSRRPRAKQCPNQCSIPQPACRCKEGYYRFNNLCLLEKDCPTEQCQQNEKNVTCAYDIPCQPTCTKPQGARVNGFDCSWQRCDGQTCVCKDGHFRHDRTGQCVPVTSCPDGAFRRTVAVARKAA